VETEVGSVRLAAVPVTVAGDPLPGVYAVGVARDREQAAVAETSRTYALVALVSLALVAGIGWVVTGRLLRPVRLLGETAQRISESDLGRRIEVTGHDDLSELARTFNGMLDRLQRAFSAQRQLLDDVGHELRTPITVVRGHVELVDASDPREVAEARELVLDELDRMNRLVDDLIVLAKARRPDFLHWADVDVAPLVDEVLDKAQGLGARRWTVDGRADAVVRADPQRLTQALLQLLANAVKFTTEEDVVALGSASDGRRVRIWVRDTGPGIPEEDHERVFQRFTRGSDTRGTEGSGLGLTIVSAIMEAHGGRVELDSAPGHGATFTLVLPTLTEETSR
jgi:two-component system, OmpR family, sensor kinase